MIYKLKDDKNVLQRGGRRASISGSGGGKEMEQFQAYEREPKEGTDLLQCP
jgi:hypothetical protein